jgi:hypothetical protein
MEVLLIDVGALAIFLVCVVTVYWHGISHEAQHRLLRDSRADFAGKRSDPPAA